MPEPYLDPAGLALVSRMELVARQAVEGFLSGLHPSPYHGSSVEYADHRPYTMGDDPRTIDWKLLAKTDKHFVKLFEEQTNCRCTILLDASRSMSFVGPSAKGGRGSPRDESGARSGGATGGLPTSAQRDLDSTGGQAASGTPATTPQLSKFQYACYAAAALAYLMLRQNDAVGLATFDREVRRYIPARGTARHFRQMLDAMAKTSPGSGHETSIGDVLHDLAGRLGPRGIVVLVSDLIDDPAALADGLGHLRFKRHEVIVLHVLDPAELSLPYDRLTRFRDIEGDAATIANPLAVRRAYQQRLTDWLDRVRRTCHERGVSYEQAKTDAPYAKMLSKYLEQRGRTKVG